MESAWICTDSNCSQYVRRIFPDHDEGRIYEVIMQFLLPNDKHVVVDQVIDLGSYDTRSSDFAERYLKPYGYDSIQMVSEVYHQDANQIIAECIAETDGLEQEWWCPETSWENCDTMIKNICGIR